MINLQFSRPLWTAFCYNLVMSAKSRMLAGKIYDPVDPELVDLRLKAHKLCSEYNQTPEEDVEKYIQGVIDKNFDENYQVELSNCKKNITQKKRIGNG